MPKRWEKVRGVSSTRIGVVDFIVRLYPDLGKELRWSFLASGIVPAEVFGKKVVIFAWKVGDIRCARQYPAYMHMRVHCAWGPVGDQATASMHCLAHMLCMRAVARKRLNA